MKRMAGTLVFMSLFIGYWAGGTYLLRGYLLPHSIYIKPGRTSFDYFFAFAMLFNLTVCAILAIVAIVVLTKEIYKCLGDE